MSRGTRVGVREGSTMVQAVIVWAGPVFALVRYLDSYDALRRVFMCQITDATLDKTQRVV